MTEPQKGFIFLMALAFVTDEVYTGLWCTKCTSVVLAEQVCHIK